MCFTMAPSHSHTPALPAAGSSLLARSRKNVGSQYPVALQGCKKYGNLCRAELPFTRRLKLIPKKHRRVACMVLFDPNAPIIQLQKHSSSLRVRSLRVQYCTYCPVIGAHFVVTSTCTVLVHIQGTLHSCGAAVIVPNGYKVHTKSLQPLVVSSGSGSHRTNDGERWADISIWGCFTAFLLGGGETPFPHP